MTQLLCTYCREPFIARVLPDGQITLACDGCLYWEPRLEVVPA